MIVLAVALVTGASGALGREVAFALDELGLSVAVHFHQDEVGAHMTAERLANSSLVVQADVADWLAVQAMEERVRHELGPVDVLVNAAAVRTDGLMATQSTTDWARVIAVNLLGTFHVCRAVVPRMLKTRDGRIINVVSPVALLGNAGQTAYAASKAGIVGLTRSLAIECGRRGVTVNALSPGFMESSLTEDVSDDARERLLSRVAIPRFTTPAEVARGVTFLVHTPYVTGQVLSIDGGLSA